MTYKGYESCSCDSSGKFNCQMLYPPTPSVPVDPPPTCACSGAQFSCHDLSQNVPQDFWLQILCVGASTKGDVTLELYDGGGDGRPVACGGVYDLETVVYGGAPATVFTMEGGQMIDHQNFPVGGSHLIVLTLQLN